MGRDRWHHVIRYFQQVGCSVIIVINWPRTVSSLQFYLQSLWGAFFFLSLSPFLGEERVGINILKRWQSLRHNTVARRTPVAFIRRGRQKQLMRIFVRSNGAARNVAVQRSNGNRKRFQLVSFTVLSASILNFVILKKNKKTSGPFACKRIWQSWHPPSIQRGDTPSVSEALSLKKKQKQNFRSFY